MGGEHSMNIELVHNGDRNTQSWVLSEGKVSEDKVKALQRGQFDVLGMMIKELPLLVFPVSSVSRIGRITERTTFVNPRHFEVPLSEFLINSQFLDILAGDSFYEKLSSLQPLIDDSAIVAIAAIMEWSTEHGLHCVATQV